MSVPPPGVTPIKMPKWGLSMDEGQIVLWLKRAGDQFREGEELVEIETSKINNAFEAPTAGLLRRVVAAEGETVPVGGLIAVAAEPDVEDAAIDAFIAEFQAEFTPGADEEADGPRLAQTAVKVGAHTVNLGIVGAGEPATILVHGFSGDLQSWALNLAELATRGRVIAVDLPGHGASSKDVGDGSVDGLASVLSDALEGVVGAGHLVGHSLGAAVAMRLAALHPGRFRTLTLVAPAGLPGGHVNADFLDGVASGQRPRDLKPWLELLFQDPGLASAEMAEDMARYKRIDGVEEALSAIRDGLLAGGAALSAAALAAAWPATLVVLGEGDRIVGAPDRTALPSGWKVVTLAAGHMPHVERADEFNRLLLAFLAENA